MPLYERPQVKPPTTSFTTPEPETTKTKTTQPEVGDTGINTLPETVQPAEYYEGYGRQLQDYARIADDTNKRVQTLYSDIQTLEGYIKNPLTLWFRREDYQDTLKEKQEALNIALTQLTNTEWRLQVLHTLPAYMASNRYTVKSTEDVLNLIPNASGGEAEQNWLKSTFDSLSYLENTLPEDFEGSVEESQQKIIDQILSEPKAEFKALHNMTVDEIAKAFQPIATELPEGLSTDDVRSILSTVDLPEEEQKPLFAWLLGKANDWAKETDRLNLIKQGITSTANIELTPSEFFKALVVQPFMAGTELLDKYLGFIVRPVAAATIIQTHELFSTSEDTIAAEMQRKYQEYRANGEGTWGALSRSLDDTDMSWWQRLLIEGAFDPTTYIGLGIATSAATKAGTMLSKIGLRGLGSRIGPFVGAIENGYIRASDAVFRAGIELVISPIKGSFWLAGAGYQIPKTITQMSRNFARSASLNFKAVLDRAFPEVKNLAGLTAKDIRDTASACIEAAITRPTEGGDLMVRSGTQLLEFSYIDADAAKTLLKDATKTLPDFDVPALAHLNDQVLNMFSGQEIKLTAGRILGDLGLEQSDAAISALTKRLSTFKDDVVEGAKSMFRSEKPSDQLIGMFEKLSDTRYNNLKSPLITHLNQAGQSVSWVSRVSDRVMQSSLLVNMERKLVMPFARWNLLFANFGPMNFLENMQRSFLGGAEVMYPKSYGGVAETNRLFRGLTNAPYELQMAERGSQRLEMALVDPKTGATSAFRGGKIPFVTKEMSVNGKVIGKRINIRGKDFKLTDMQSYNDMWEEMTTLQRAYDYQVHYMKALPEVAPDEMRQIIGVVDSHINELQGMRGLSKSDIQDIRRTAIEMATVGPDEFRHMADLDVLELERRQISKELGKTFDKCTDVHAFTKKGIRDEVLDGGIFKDIDGRVAAWTEAEREMSLASLANQIDALKTEADQMLKAYTNTGTLLDELSQDLAFGNIKPLSSGVGIDIYEAPLVLGGENIGNVKFVHNEIAPDVLRVDTLSITKPGTLNRRLMQDTELLIHNEASKRGAKNVVVLAKKEHEAMYSLSGYKRVHGKVPIYEKSVMRPKTRAPETLDELLTDMDNISAIQNAVDERIHDYRRMVELRAAKLKPGKEVDDFHVGSAKLLNQFMESSRDNMNRIIDQMHDFLMNRPVVLGPKGENISTLGMSGSQINAANAINEMYRMETSNIINTRNRLAEIEAKITKTPPAKRDARFWSQQRADKALIWDEHEVNARRLKNLRMDSQRQFLGSIGKAPYVPKQIPEVTGKLTPSHIAHLFGVTGDDTYRGLTRIHTHVTVRPKEEWIDYVKNQANAYSSRFNKTAADIGFTDDAIGDIYDQLWHNLGIDPKILTPDSPTVLQLDDIRTELNRLHAAMKLDDSDIAKWRQFHQGVASDLESAPMYQKAGANDWFAKKEKAMTEARKQHELAYPTYDDANVIDESMRAIFPFWTYELFRWRWLPRTFMRTPGTFTNIARFMDYTDGGYVNVPGTDLQINPLRGSIWMGGMRRFWLKDFPEYYDAFPGMEFIDYIGRAGFYPGIQIMAPITIFGAATGKPELSEIVPTWMQTGLNALRAVSPEHLGKVIDYVFPDRFRDYQTMLTLGEWGYDADEIWNKKKSGAKLTPEEESLWLRAENKADGLKGILMEQTGLFRIRPREYDQMKQEMQLAIQDATGVPVRIQQRIDRLYPITGKRFSDYYKLDVLQSKLLYESESYRRWQGVATPLYPSSWQMLEVKIKEYWDTLEKNTYNARHLGTFDSEGNLLRPSIAEINRQFVSGEIGPDQWKSQRDAIQTALAEASNALATSPAYSDVPKTLDEREAWLKEKGIATPTYGADQELLWYYYELEPEMAYNWDSDRMELDYDTYYAKVDMLLESLTEPYRQRLLERIQMDWTPMERLYWQISREYFRPYRNIRSIILKTYSEEERAQIRRYEVARGDERTALQEVIGQDGQNLIAGFNSKVREARQRLRYVDPTLDAWSYFFGNTDSFLTKESELQYKEFVKQYMTAAMVE